MSFVIGSQLPAIIKLPSNFIPVIKVSEILEEYHVT